MIDQYWFPSFSFTYFGFQFFQEVNIFLLVSINLFLFLVLLFWSICEKLQFWHSLKSVIVTAATGSLENKRAENSEVALHLLVTVFLCVGGGGLIVSLWFTNPCNGQG